MRLADINMRDMTKLSLKQELRRLIASGSKDVPDRGATGKYGTKNPTSRSEAIKRIKQAKTPFELTIAARGARTLADQHAAIRKDAVFKLNSMPANRELVFKLDWHEVFQPEDANIARECIREFLVRMLRGIHRSAKLELDFAAQNFVVVPEIWSKMGTFAPLHFHALIDIPTAGLPSFDAGAKSIWESVCRAHKIKGSIHSSPIKNKDRLDRYNLKQLDLEWVFDRTMWPIDLLD